jgi:hypothetical protein
VSVTRVGAAQAAIPGVPVTGLASAPSSEPRPPGPPQLPTASPPLDRPVDLVIHLGSGKTGTTSIQRFLQGNRSRLAEHGYLFPRSPGSSRHMRFGLMIRPDAELTSSRAWRLGDYPSPATFRRQVRRRLFREINRSGLSRVILSDEALYLVSDDALSRLKRFTDRVAGQVRLVVYLRRQDDHLISRYQQGVKTGGILRLDEFMQERGATQSYDYFTRLSSWRRLVEPAAFAVRPFERVRFPDGSLYQDFLDAASIDLRADDFAQTEPQNHSLDAEAVEVLRLLNLCRVEHAGYRAGDIRNADLIPRLHEHSTGPVISLPEHLLDAFMRQWEDANRAVARHFLHDETGVLFRTPRRTANTTTEQRLDPARVDHYIALLELPEEIHAPFRRIADREAARPSPG